MLHFIAPSRPPSRQQRKGSRRRDALPRPRAAWPRHNLAWQDDAGACTMVDGDICWQLVCTQCGEARPMPITIEPDSKTKLGKQFSEKTRNLAHEAYDGIKEEGEADAAERDEVLVLRVHHRDHGPPPLLVRGALERAHLVARPRAVARASPGIVLAFGIAVRGAALIRLALGGFLGGARSRGRSTSPQRQVSPADCRPVPSAPSSSSSRALVNYIATVVDVDRRRRVAVEQILLNTPT